MFNVSAIIFYKKIANGARKRANDLNPDSPEREGRQGSLCIIVKTRWGGREPSESK